MNGYSNNKNTHIYTLADNTNLAVSVRSAYKSYEKDNFILKGLNLNVPENKIYGLLGPSGCGKTTLLHSILGRSELCSGKVTLKYRKLRDIGYMPQNIALHQELSIRELFLYYGMMFNMSESAIKERFRFLLKFLELPNDSRIVGTLSGGQQRRMSFALSILHDPKFLVLDEPTVGLDPILCQSIWNMLREMTSEGKTIIITTHYIEEAKSSDVVGIMRRGRLLAEKCPLELLTESRCEYLEDAFLHLCKEDEQKSKEENSIGQNLAYVVPNKNNKSTSKTVDFDDGFSFYRFKAQLIKNLWMLRRSFLLTAFVLILPLVQISTFQMATGADPIDLPIAFFNEEVPYSYCANKSQNIYDKCFLNESAIDSVYLSCNMLQLMEDKKFKLIEYFDLETAKKAVIKNDVWVLMHFNSNFTQHLATRFNEGNLVTNDTIDSSNVNTFVDQSNHYISHFIKTKLLKSYKEMTDLAFTSCELDSSIAQVPIKLMDPVYGSEHTTFRDYTGPSMLSLTAFYLPVLYTGAMLLFEKDGGILERVMFSGMTFTEIAASHFVIQLTFIIIQNLACMIQMYSRLIFNAPFEGSVITTYCLLFCISTVGMLFGFLIALVSKNQTEAAYFGIGCNFLMKFLCGMMWPTQGMNYCLHVFSNFLPITFATDALRSLGSRGWGLDHHSIQLGFISTIVWIPILLLLSFVIMKRNKNWYE